MKTFFVVIALVLSMNANASLISFDVDQASYNDGDTVVVDIFLNSANPDLDWLEIEFLFDNSLLSFDQFFVTDDVWNNTDYDDAYSDLSSLFVFVGFLADWSVELGTSFKLGQAEFIAIGDITDVNLTTVDIFAQDADFNQIAPQQVPEPSTVALIALSGLLLMNRRRKQ